MFVRLPLAALTMSVALTAGAAQAGDCGDGDWSLGGTGFGVDAAALAARSESCAAHVGRCELTVDGIDFVVGFEASGPRLLYKRRALLRDESLPFGVTLMDTPASALTKVLARTQGGYGRTMDVKHASVGAFCGAADGAFLLQFEYDASGRMTGVSETWLAGRYAYVTDPTFSFTPASRH